MGHGAWGIGKRLMNRYLQKLNMLYPQPLF
jgi:hypothetical protein